MQRTRRAMREFLALPAAVVAVYVVLAGLSVAVDKTSPRWLHPILGPLGSFIDKGTASTLLSAIATSVVTVTAITFSVLLLAVQQTAAAMTPVVFDQFLRRRTNQLYLGMFVGLSMYAFLDLASIHPPVVPVFGASLGLLLTIASLCALMVLIYSTVDQMRPNSVTQLIHDHGRRARADELGLIRRTRRASCCAAPERATVRAERDGFVTRIDLDAIGATLRAGGDAEVTFLITRGTHIAFQQRVAVVRAEESERADEVAASVRKAVQLDRGRDLDVDPSLAVTELGNIAWTAISSAKHNPQTGREAIDRLRDLLARWSRDDSSARPHDEGAAPEVLPIVYADTDVDALVDTLVGLLVASAEAVQPDTSAYVLHAVAVALPELSSRAREGTQRALATTLPAIDDLVVTRPLERALDEVRETLGTLDDGPAGETVRGLLDDRLARAAALRAG